ncbi:MAG: LysR family transcriptional regulator [Ruminococcaceae bacterium]|nr:LysR family transcriptional regulator [Oscillospiraceae bacterium]
MLDFRVITFLTLYDEMNYRKTAEKLSMTQPGVTQHIHYLESYYGVKLFIYDGNSRLLKRTKNAERLKKYFDSIRAEERDIKNKFIKDDKIFIKLGATKTIGEFVIVPEIRNFLKGENHSLELFVDNTEVLLQKLEKSELDFAIIEGVFDKSKYGYKLYKKENFVGICAQNHPFANKSVSLNDAFSQDIIVREPLSGTRNLLENAIKDLGFSLSNFKRCISVSNFSLICDLVVNIGAITFAYEPISRCRDDLATFSVTDINISGEFNFVYCSEKVAEEKINMIFK